MSDELDAALKRFLDVSVAGLGLLVLLPVLVMLAALVKTSSRGPVLFAQDRIGRGMRPFRLLKFRTMLAAAPGFGPTLTIGDDWRITPVGRVLRHYKLDELPQLLNVLRGDMSLVGPRPEVPEYVSLYRGRASRLLTVRPGLTDPASLAYRDESSLLAGFPDAERAYRETVLPHKIELSLAYLERRTVWTDLGVVLATLRRLAGPGAPESATAHGARR